MKKINITITGALGRMGQILINRISKNKNLKLVSLTDIRVGKEIKGIKIQNNSFEAFKKTDVIIDFSRPKSSIEILNFAKKLKKKVIVGTTGFTKKDENIIKNYSKKIAIFKSGNMSLGINLLEYITKILSKKIPNKQTNKRTTNKRTTNKRTNKQKNKQTKEQTNKRTNKEQIKEQIKNI